jgi:phosphoribosylformimino-5-aminoimidazole carboxamide ribotide isomerase
MIILPAIDMIAGKPVRLYQGDYAKSEIVASSVLETARAFAQSGASYIHMVDLDGAKSGSRENAKLIAECARSVTSPVEVGGGIRTMDDISWYLQNGVSRVILGTAAVENEELLKSALAEYGEKIAVGMDCRNGYAATRGWLESSDLYYLDFAKHLENLGVKNIIFTDISRDGTLSGPNLQMLEALSKHVSCDITASGGIKNIDDIRALKKLGLYGAIAGKAIYTKDIDLMEAIRVCEEEE